MRRILSHMMLWTLLLLGSGAHAQTTVIYQDDFEGPVTGWSDNSTDFAPAVTNFLGRFAAGQTTTSRTFTVPPDSDDLVIEFDLYRFDSWDNSSQFGFDRFQVEIDGVQIFSLPFPNPQGARSGTAGNVEWSHAPLTGTEELGFTVGQFWFDQLHRFEIVVSNPNATVTLTLMAALTQAENDESAGYDNFLVTAVAPPPVEPPGSCPAGTAAVPGTYHVVSANVAPSTGGNPENINGALGAPAPEGSTDGGNGTFSGTTFFQSLIYDLTGDPDISLPGGTVIEASFANHFSSNPTGNISMSSDGVSYTSVGSSTGPWTSNTFRYDDYVVPPGGARFMEVGYGGGGGLRFDGVIYDTQCQPASTPVELEANKTVSVYDPQDLSLYAVPGNDVIYTITIENVGAGEVDSGSLFLVDNLPGDITFFNDDIDDAGPEINPVAFEESSTGLTFDYATTVGFSDGTTAPTSFAECTYIPTPGYDPDVKFICINPSGSMAGGSKWSASFRSRIS